jgi:hypothetical protein
MSSEWYLPFRLLTTILYVFHIFPMLATCPPNVILDFIILITCLPSEEDRLCSFLLPPVSSFLLGPNIPLSTLFSNTRNLCSSQNVRDQILHPNKQVKL